MIKLHSTGNSRFKSRQGGSALLTALFIITLVAIVTTAISKRITIDVQHVNLIESTDRLYLASQAVTFWAMDRLVDPKQNLSKASDAGVILTYPTSLQHLYPNITISGQLYDLQARFNLNNLLEEAFQPVFFGLLNSLKIGTSVFERKEIMDALINWLQPLKFSTAQDEWYDRYAKQKPPYFPSHFPMQHASELRLVYGVTAKFYQRLSPFITTLPETAAININTASRTLLTGLGYGLKGDALTKIINDRSTKPFKNAEELKPIVDKYHIQAATITFESHYFLVAATTQISDLTFQSYVMIKRKQDKTGLWHTSILSQSFNTM